MELKNALSVCLVSLFSATLVLLIARALDVQTATRLEPQLAAIVEELQAIRKQGGITAGPAPVETSADVQDGLIVYYFHGKVRCTTCRAIESQARGVVQADFAAELASGDVTWKVLNFDELAGAGLAKKFETNEIPVVVLAKMKGGEIAQWKRLDRVWALVGDKPAYAKYVRDEIHKLLRPGASPPTGKAAADQPEAKDAVPGAADKPLPPPADLPIPP